MKKLFFILLLLIFLGMNLNGQTEELSYEVYYNWGIIWIDGGSLTLSTHPDTLNSIPLLRLEGTGKSLPRWNWLFKLDDHYTSWCYPDSYYPVLATKNTSEGGYRISNRYTFDYNDSLVYIRTEETRKPLTLDTLSFKKPLYDVQSATSKLRFLNFTHLRDGDTITLPIIMDGVVHQQSIVFNGYDTLRIQNKMAYSTLKFTAMVTDNKLFSSDNAIKVWISNDTKRIPLYIEADITIGAIKVFYKEGL
jgi:hypothetical protein